MAAKIDYQSNRNLQAGLVLFEQVDFFLPDETTRATGILPVDLSVKLQLGATSLTWPVVSGVGVPDVRVAAGKVYWEEFEAGFYSIRLFPNQVGVWRLIVTWTAGDQAVSHVYDVSAKPSPQGILGLRASFVK